MSEMNSRDSNCRKQWQQRSSSLGGGIITVTTLTHDRRWRSTIQRVLHGLRHLERALRLDPPPPTLQPEEVIDHLLSRIPDGNNNSMPSEAILRAIVSNPNSSLVIAYALSSDTAEMDGGGGMKGQFRLSHMNKLAAHRKPLRAFMFFTGALTYVPSTAVRQARSSYPQQCCSHRVRKGTDDRSQGEWLLSCVKPLSRCWTPKRSTHFAEPSPNTCWLDLLDRMLTMEKILLHKVKKQVLPCV